MSSENIASIFIEAQLDTTKLQKQLLALESRNLKISVNDQALTDLNKHLDLKVKHFKQVQHLFDSSPLTVKVAQPDTRAIEDIKKQFQATRLQMKLDSSNLKAEIHRISKEVTSTTVVRPQVILGKPASNKSEYEQLGNEIAQSIGKAVSKGHFLTNALGGAFNLSVGGVFRGAFEGLGRNLTKDFSKGLSNSLQAGLNQSIGSTNLVGERLGEEIVNAITDKIPGKLKEKLQDTISGVLGEENILLETKSAARKAGRSTERKEKATREQINIDRQTALRTIREEGAREAQIQSLLDKNYEEQNKNFSLDSSLQEKRIKNPSKKLDEQIGKVSEELAKLAEQEALLLVEQEKTEKKLKAAKKDLERARKAYALTAPEKLPQAYMQAVKDVGGARALDSAKIPKLVTNDSVLKDLKANAAYAVESNTILIDSAMKEALELGQLTAKQMETLYHELQHAVDFDFGSVKGVEAARSNVVLGRPLTPTKQELSKVAPLIRGYSPEERAFELNAEVAGLRKGGKAFEKQQMFLNAEMFEKSFGADGSKLANIFKLKVKQLNENVAKLKKFSDLKGVDATEELTKFFEKVEETSKAVATIQTEIKKAQEFQLNTKEIKDLEGNITSQVEEIEKLSNYLTEIQNQILQKIKNKVDIPFKEAKVAEKVEIEAKEKAAKASKTMGMHQRETRVNTSPGSNNIDNNASRVFINSLSEFETGMGRIKTKILPSFKKAFTDIKKDISDNNLTFVSEDQIGAIAKAKTLLESIAFAKEDIEKTRTDLGIAKIGTPEANKINQRLGELGRVEKSVKRELTKLKNKLEKSGDNQTIEQLRFQRFDPLKKNQGATEESKQQLDELNDLLSSVSDNMDDFDFKSEKANKKVSDSFKKSGDAIKNFADNMFDTSKQVESFDEVVADVFNSLEGYFAGFLGFTALAIAGKALVDFVGIATQTAREMESITLQVSNVAGGGVKGSNFAAEIQKTAEDLRLNIKDSLQAASGFKASIEGTSIEGALGDATFKNFQQLLAARNVNTEKTKNFLLALEQSASKGVQSEELRGQMAEAVSGIVGYFARSQGQSNKQFMETMRRTTGGLDQSVLFEASQQAAAETQQGLTRSFETAESKATNFQNKLIKLQVAVGNVFLPLEKLKFDVLATTIETLVSNSELLGKAIVTAGLYLSRGTLLAGLKLIREGWITASKAVKSYTADVVLSTQIQTSGLTRVQKLQFVAAKGFTKMKLALGGITKAFLPFLAISAALETVGAIANTIRINFTDLSGEIKNFVENAELAVESLEKLAKTGQKTEEIRFATDAQSQTEIYRSNQGFFERFNPFDQGQAEGNKKAFDSLKNTEKLLKLSQEIRKQSDSPKIFGDIEVLSKIDRKLGDIRNKREAIIKLQPDNTQALNELRKQEESLVQKRGEQILGIGGFQSAIKARIDELKTTRESLTQQAKEGFIFEENYKKSVKEIDTELEKLEKQQNKITKAIGKSKNAFDIFKRSVAETDSKYADIQQAINAERISKDINTGLLLNRKRVSQEQSVFSNEINGLKAQAKQLQETKNLISIRSEQFNNAEASSILNAFGIGENSGVNQIRNIAERLDNENQKFVLEEFAKYQELKQQLKENALEVLQARSQLQQKFTDITREVTDYYTKIAREAETSSLDIKKLNLENSKLSLQNKLQKSIAEGYDTIIGSIVQNIESALEGFSSATDEAIASQRQLLESSFSLQDAQKTSLEITRKIPEVKVGLDFSSIPSDNNISRLGDEIDSAVDGSDSLSSSINQNTRSSDELYRSLEMLIHPLIEQEKQSSQINDSMLKTVETSNTFENSLNKIPSTLGEVDSSFKGIGNSITNLLAQTTQWLGKLADAPGLLGNVVSNIGKAFSGANNTGGVASNSGFVSPVKGVSLDRLIAYKPTRGQGFYGMRSGGRQHRKVDFDSRVNAGQGAEILASISGTAKARMITPISGGVDIHGKDSKGNNITVVYNHLRLDELTKFFRSKGGVGKKGGFKPIQVNAGDRLGSVTMDSLSTGAHLDFGIKVNGQYVKPQKWLATEGKAMQQMQKQLTPSNNSGSGSGTSPNLVEFVKDFESFHPKAYWDYQQYSVGYGTKATSPNEQISKPEAEKRLLEELAKAQAIVTKQTAGIKLNQNQLNALTSLVYNTGSLSGFPNLMSNLRSGNMQGAAREFLDINKAGGKVLPGLTRRRQAEARMFLSSSSPQELKKQVGFATNIQTATIQQKSQALQTNSRLKQQRALIQAETALNKVRRQNEKLLLETEDKEISRARALTDAQYSAIAFPSKQQQDLKASTDIARQKQDALRQFKKDVLNAQRTVEESNKFIKASEESLVSETDPNRRNVLQVGIEETQKVKAIKLKEIEDLNKKIAATTKAFDAQEKARFEKANFEEYLRSSKVEIQLQTEQNALLQERINKLEKIKEVAPTDSRLKELPDLREKLALSQLEVEIASKLLEIEEQIKRSGNDPKITSELNKQLQLLEQQNATKTRTIYLTTQQQIEEQKRSELLRKLNIDSKFADFENQRAENLLKQQEKASAKNTFGIDTGELKKARYELLQTQETLASIELQKNIQEAKDFARENGLSASKTRELIANVKELNAIKLTEIRGEFNNLVSADKISELQKIQQNLNTRFQLLQQPGIDLQNARADALESVGGNQFVVNKMRRDAGIQQEMFARDEALRNLDIQVAQARSQGIEVTDAKVSELRNNLVELSELKLDGLNNQFKSISTTLGDIAKQGLQTFSSGIADLITKGGSLEDVFDNMFDNILNSVINMGLNSLLGGLFGGGLGGGNLLGSIFGGGLFYKGKLPGYASGKMPSYAYGGIHNAMIKERLESGRKPQLAIVHDNELIIPASRTEELAKAGLSPEMLLGSKTDNYAYGKMPKSSVTDNKSGGGTLNIETTVVNNQEYVSMDQLQIAMQEATKRGSEEGVRKVQLKMQNSTSFRNSVGI